MVLAANEKYSLVWNNEGAIRYRVYMTSNSMFKQEVWHGVNMNTKALQKFFSDREIRQAKAKRAAERYIDRRLKEI